MVPGTTPGPSFQRDQKARVHAELTVIQVERIEEVLPAAIIQSISPGPQ